MPFRWMPLALGACVLAAVIGLAMIAAVFLSPWGVRREEILRVRCNSLMLDAVLVETDGGATTALGHLVYLVSPGARPQGEPVAVMSSVSWTDDRPDVALRFDEEGGLTIRHGPARWVWLNQPIVTIKGRTHRIALVEDASDQSFLSSPPDQASHPLSGEARRPSEEMPSS